MEAQNEKLTFLIKKYKLKIFKLIDIQTGIMLNEFPARVFYYDFFVFSLGYVPL